MRANTELVQFASGAYSVKASHGAKLYEIWAFKIPFGGSLGSDAETRGAAAMRRPSQFCGSNVTLTLAPDLHDSNFSGDATVA